MEEPGEILSWSSVVLQQYGCLEVKDQNQPHALTERTSQTSQLIITLDIRKKFFTQKVVRH